MSSSDDESDTPLHLSMEALGALREFALDRGINIGSDPFDLRRQVQTACDVQVEERPQVSKIDVYYDVLICLLLKFCLSLG